MQTDNNKKWYLSKTARSIFYILFIGGLFLLMSFCFENVCNRVILEKYQLPCINTLEAAGIIAFGYIIYYGIKFGIDSFKVDKSNGQ